MIQQVVESQISVIEKQDRLIALQKAQIEKMEEVGRLDKLLIDNLKQQVRDLEAAVDVLMAD